MDKNAFVFSSPLIEGVIQKRKSQFTMIVEIQGEAFTCHCPTTGRIGSMDINGRPCLLSKSSDQSRKTLYTVEAVSLNKEKDLNKFWIGINQNAVNRYVEHFLRNGSFHDMIDTYNNVLREQKLGVSKLDFLVGNTYLEVKTPLQGLQVTYPDYIKLKKTKPLDHTDRFVKHIKELGSSLNSHQRAILLGCFVYDNPGFQVIEPSANADEVSKAVREALLLGVELWQANFKITPYCVTLERYFRMTI